LIFTAFGSLQFLGTLAAPMIGVLGARVMLCAIRAIYASLAGVLMALGLSRASMGQGRRQPSGVRSVAQGV